jgi:hypothetical protein
MLVLETVEVNLRIDCAIPSVPRNYFIPRFVGVVDFGIVQVEQEDSGRWMVEFGADELHTG